MDHRRRRSCLVVASLATAFAATGWLPVSACSPSTTTSAPVDDGGATGDQEAIPEPPPEDAGAPDVLGDTVNAPCNVVAQDCVDPSLRCQIIFTDGEYVAGCQPPWHPAVNTEGKICSRTKVGHDDCVKGLHCVPDGVTATSCRRLCEKDSDCAAGAKCGAITTLPPYFGVCWKTCTPFGGECPGESCAAPHFAIDQVNTFEACREIGTGGLGASCKAQWNCAEDMNCYGTSGFKCNAMCDDAHPCDGGTCKKFAGLPQNGGVCQ
jgi:hypothetical protein